MLSKSRPLNSGYDADHHDDSDMPALGPATAPLASIPILLQHRRSVGCFTYPCTAIALHGMMSRLLVEELPYPVAIVVRDKVNLSIAARRLVDALEEAFVRAAGVLPACQRS